MAGARIPAKELSLAARRRLRDDLVRDFLAAFGVRTRRPRSLV
jgi:hypothetical protein